MRLILFSLLSGFLLTSCGNIPCGPAELDFRLIGFSAAECDTMIVRRLKKNSNEIISSVEYNPANPVRFVHFSDTAIMVAYPADLIMRSHFDYQLVFPAANRTFHITEITEVISYTQKRGLFSNTKEYCMNTISDCKIDGLLESRIQFANLIYLRK